MHAVAPLIDESSGESPLTVEYPGNGVIRFNAAIRVAIKRYNHAVTWATRHFISLISISKKYESNFKEISKLHLLVVIYECTSGQRKHSSITPQPLPVDDVFGGELMALCQETQREERHPSIPSSGVLSSALRFTGGVMEGVAHSPLTEAGRAREGAQRWGTYMSLTSPPV